MEEVMHLASLGTGYGEKILDLPRGATTIALEFDEPIVYIIFRAEKDVPTEQRRFLVIKPGMSFSNAGKYVGRISRVREVPIPKGMILPVGATQADCKAVEKLDIFVFEKLPETEPI